MIKHTTNSSRMFSNFFRPAPLHFQYEVAICCIVKDENPYLQEWIAYHQKIGVEHFFLYDNESATPVEGGLQQQVDKGIATVEQVQGKGIQKEVYRQCIIQHGSKCRWIAFIDADEFIVPKIPFSNLSEFLLPYRKYGGLGINWLVFGSSGHVHRQNEQIRPYTKCIPKGDPINNHIKSIVQPRFIKTKKPPADPHHFRFIIGRYCVNENFKRIKNAFSKHSSDLIQLNHYNLRSLEEYREKQERGRADAIGHIRELEYFYEIDKNAVATDETILEVLKMLK